MALDYLRSDCPLCSSAARAAGEKVGRLAPEPFALLRCDACRYSFVANPRTDYAALYDRDYYEGHGADPLVDYATELDHPESTVRCYEWRGLLRVIDHLAGPLQGKRWLDFGCGNGGLVRAGRERGFDITGYDQGWICERARSAGIPILEEGELDRLRGSMDIVTAVEVIEHLVDPVEVLRKMRSLMKPGGVLFVTTGNARPFRNKLPAWSYVVPEVHVGFFEPEALAEALRRSGFEPEWPGYVPGFTDIVRFKVLKSLGVRRRGGWERLVPWPAAARVVDRRYGVSAHPIGKAV